ncbi:AtpZ/AtpI family protein [Falsiroseomonas oryziterrae]|uniref:AtpZ/AtpI family protein n=1 Tax=Falsiroseomonas oryziterrae TaxID=2911368 RepID=UPI001F16FB9E|nr:AtpZ/AtpI family protein [Roseomonas sp. NPKOSM-4]
MPDKDGFEERLRQARARHGVDTPPGGGQLPQGGTWGFGLRAGVEVVSALIVGVAAGWFLDRWLGTWPWLFLLFFVLGSVAGVLNVYRLFNPARRGPGPS